MLHFESLSIVYLHQAIKGVSLYPCYKMHDFTHIQWMPSPSIYSLNCIVQTSQTSRWALWSIQILQMSICFPPQTEKISFTQNFHASSYTLYTFIINKVTPYWTTYQFPSHQVRPKGGKKKKEVTNWTQKKLSVHLLTNSHHTPRSILKTSNCSRPETSSINPE